MPVIKVPSFKSNLAKVRSPRLFYTSKDLIVSIIGISFMNSYLFFYSIYINYLFIYLV